MIFVLQKNKMLNKILTGSIFILLAMQSFAQGGKITGTVVDENGETIPGASIYLQSESSAKRTDINGNFELPIAAGTYTMVVKFVSYKEKIITGITVKENEATNLSVDLIPQDEEAINHNATLHTYKFDEEPRADQEIKKMASRKSFQSPIK